MDKEFKAKADLFFSVLSQGKFGSIEVYHEKKKSSLIVVIFLDLMLK